MMGKMFLAASLVLLVILSLASLATGEFFNFMRPQEDFPGPMTIAGNASGAAGEPLFSTAPFFTDNAFQLEPAISFKPRFPQFPARATVNDAPGPDQPSGYRLHDSFDSLRSDLWTISSYRPDSEIMVSRFVPSCVWSGDGTLVLRTSVADNTGGEYRSNARFSPGKFRASIRVEQAPGTYLTFFTYGCPSDGSSRVHNEIDIELIIDSGRPTAMLSTWRDYVKSEYLYPLPFDPSAGYHTYGFDWYSDHVDFYIDDMARPVWTSRSNIPQEPMHVYFNSWVCKNPPAGDGTGTEYVDWVTVE